MRALIVLSALLVGCNTVSPYDRELAAYRDMLGSAVAAGRMTPSEANYLYIAKQNELGQRRAANTSASMGMGTQGLILMDQNRASPIK